MITFEPDTPWQVGDYVILRNGGAPVLKVVTAAETSEDGSETRYTMIDAVVDEADRYQYYNPEVAS